MERKIGEVFEFEGKKCAVVEGPIPCRLICSFIENCDDKKEILGECYGRERIDRKYVHFVEVKE